MEQHDHGHIGTSLTPQQAGDAGFDLNSLLAK